MPFVVDTSKVKLNEENAYTNNWGAQCVALVQNVPVIGGGSVPRTSDWRKGKYVKELKAAEISNGTIIATFDENGKYPSTARHAAIYINHDEKGITVYDQWASRPKVLQRVLLYKGGENRQVDDGDYYWIVETDVTASLNLTEPWHQSIYNSVVKMFG